MEVFNELPEFQAVRVVISRTLEHIVLHSLLKDLLFLK